MTKFAAIMTGLTLALAACKSTAVAQDIPAAMRQTATTLLQSTLLHATSIAVVYRGKQFILHQGELESGKDNPPDDTTLYEIGSVSKTFAGLLLANAVLDGKAALDDPVQQYLAADYPNLQWQGQPVRLRHLITHTSNMPGMLPLQVNAILNDFTAHATPAKLNAAYASYGQQQFWQDLHTVSIKGPLGKDYAYSSAATELVAHAWILHAANALMSESSSWQTTLCGLLMSLCSNGRPDPGLKKTPVRRLAFSFRLSCWRP